MPSIRFTFLTARRPACASSASKLGGTFAPVPSQAEWLVKSGCMLTFWGAGGSSIARLVQHLAYRNDDPSASGSVGEEVSA
jgi:hypothetical protein